jgi:hypothetical protein
MFASKLVCGQVYFVYKEKANLFFVLTLWTLDWSFVKDTSWIFSMKLKPGLFVSNVKAAMQEQVGIRKPGV